MSDTSLTKLYELHVPVCTIVFGVPAIGHDGEPIQQTVKYNGRDIKTIAHDNVTVEPGRPAWIPVGSVKELKAKGLLAPYVKEIHSEPPPEPETNEVAVLQAADGGMGGVTQPDPNLAKGKGRAPVIDPLA